MKVEYHEILSSTMDRARQVEAPALIVAAKQTNGRGRVGNVWQSDHRGLYFTAALTKAKSSQHYQGLSLAVGVWLAEALEKKGEKIELKWPNDLLNSEGKKLGGILIELLSESVLIGVGVNLSKPENLPASAALNSKITDLKSLAEDLAGEVAKGFIEFEKHGFLAFREAWLTKSCWRDSLIQGIIGNEVVAGIFRGVDETGLLLLETEGEIKKISSGEILKLQTRK